VPFAPNTLIARRYKLLESLGAGGMGEVWKAQDTNFTRSVLVAVKFLREDETLITDARRRGTFARSMSQAAAKGPLTVEAVVSALDDTFRIGSASPTLRDTARSRWGQSMSPDDALQLFDEVANDTAYNEDARHRKRMRDLFAAEANAVAVLHHPNIVRVIDYGEESGQPFLVMDYVNGRTLHQVIERGDALPLHDRLAFMEDLCDGLGYAHGKGLVHRDIKPANLIIDNETERLKILDFGVARALQLSAEASLSMGMPMGTYSYMSPEQTRAARTLDHRSDIFSVGVVFYEFLSGQRAFPPGNDLRDLIDRIEHHPPKSLRSLLPALDPALERIVYRAMEKDPALRYQDLTDMRREIAAVRARQDEDADRMTSRDQAETVLVRDDPPSTRTRDMLAAAHAAFARGDDRVALDLCRRVLVRTPSDSEALKLRQDVEAHLAQLVDAALREGRRLLDDGDIASAERILDRPELDLRSTAVREFIHRLEERRQQGRGAGETSDEPPVQPTVVQAETTRKPSRAEEQRLKRELEERARRVRNALKKKKYPAAEQALAQLARMAGSEALVTELQAALTAARGTRVEAPPPKSPPPAPTPQPDAAPVDVPNAPVDATVVAAGETQSPEPETLVQTPAFDEADDPARDLVIARQQEEAARARLAEELARIEEAEREERARDERAAAVVAAANHLFAANRYDESVQQLADFRPEHPVVQHRLAWMQRERARVEQASAFDAERQRLDAERAELMNEAQAYRQRREFAAALEISEGAQTLETLKADARKLRADLLQDLRATVAEQPPNPALALLLARYDVAAYRRKVIIQASTIVAATGVAAAVGLMLYTRERTTPVISDGPPPAQPTSTPTTVPPATVDVTPPTRGAPAAEPVSVTVNLAPWARVRITPADSGVPAPEQQITPFTVSLPPGEYTLHAENGGLTDAETFPITVKPGEPLVVSRPMKGFDANRVVSTLLGTQR
jgi:serine/threonine protein kinase